MPLGIFKIMNKLTFLSQAYPPLFLCLLLFPCFVLANSGLQAEIKYLISFIENSDCTFIRNGSEYDTQKAVQHIQKKYKYFKANINSTEKFIELSASKSTRTNKPYFVKCGKQQQISSQQWLLKELKRYRALQNSN